MLGDDIAGDGNNAFFVKAILKEIGAWPVSK